MGTGRGLSPVCPRPVLKFMEHKQDKQQQGISLFITMLIISILSGSLLTLSLVISSQMKVVFDLGDAVVSFIAADACAERALYNTRQLDPAVYDNFFIDTFSSGARCDVVIDAAGPEIIIKSTGSHKGTKRAIEVKF